MLGVFFSKKPRPVLKEVHVFFDLNYSSELPSLPFGKDNLFLSEEKIRSFQTYG
ncbi:hypothetical protein [Methylacidiphilum caldifontis]|uniref:hypothetical protein n=1 Tax=Methylacidiphilum caldifontis TaxID=2795386 RepID=UPI001ABC7DC9|nr:hypothetical protein [Methylacidiphilum caldifontis]